MKLIWIIVIIFVVVNVLFGIAIIIRYKRKEPTFNSDFSSDFKKKKDDD